MTSFECIFRAPREAVVRGLVTFWNAGVVGVVCGREAAITSGMLAELKNVRLKLEENSLTVGTDWYFIWWCG